MKDDFDKKSYDNQVKKSSSYWKKRLEKYFENSFIDDMTDFNYSTCFTYLISLSNVNNSLTSPEMSLFLESNDAYFLEILISNKKPLISFHFWQYSSQNKNLDNPLQTSTKAYLKKDKSHYENIIKFIDENSLIFVSDENLKSKVLLKGKEVSFYYKYFNQEGEDPLNVPYSRE